MSTALDRVRALTVALNDAILLLEFAAYELRDAQEVWPGARTAAVEIDSAIERARTALELDKTRE